MKNMAKDCLSEGHTATVQGFRPTTFRRGKKSLVNASVGAELARDGLKGDAFIQKARVIVNVYREQARLLQSYSVELFSFKALSV